MAAGGWRQVVAIMLAAVATLVVIGVGLAAPLERTEPASNVAAGPAAATHTPDLGVRSLPLIVPGGAMDTLPSDRPFTADQGGQALGRALQRVGLTGSFPLLLDAMEGDLTHIQREPEPMPAYPHRYPFLEAAFARAASDASIRDTDPKAWIDLASVLTVNAARAEEDQFTHQASAMLAQVILVRVRQWHDVCDVQLSLAHVVSLGMRPDWAGTHQEFRAAQRLCAGDPTPLVALGTWQLRSQRRGILIPIGHPGDAAAVAFTAMTFIELDHAFPDLPLGPAGLAENALQAAEALDDRRTRPFVARAAYQRALTHLGVARSRSAAPELLIAEARAQLGLRRPAEALALTDRLLTELPGQPAGLVVRSWALLELRDFGALAQNADAYAQARSPNLLSLNRRSQGATALSAPVGMMVSQTEAVDAHVADATTPSGMGGGDVVDLGFLPEHRLLDGPRQRLWEGNHLALYAHFLNGDRAGFDRAMRSLEADSAADPPLLSGDYDPYFADSLKELARDEWDGVVGDRGAATRLNDRQDLWRSVGDWARARRATEQWTTLLPNDGFAWDRRGETEFLAGDARAALRSFVHAARLLRSGESVGYDPGPDQRSPAAAARMASVKAAAAHEELGHREQAKLIYFMVIDEEVGGLDEAEFYAASQLGLLLLRQEHFAAAKKPLEWALWVAHRLDRPEDLGPGQITPHLKGAQENNLALALVRDGRADEAIPYASAALARDPDNPIFIETLSYARDQAGDLDAARAGYEVALAADPTNYVARNNLGVHLGQSGDHAGARAHFEAALAVRPDYAFAWHNLGVAAGRSGRFLEGQASLRRSGVLDIGLRGAKPAYGFDHRIYQSGLDVSRPLPPDWTFGEAGRLPVGFSLAVLAVVVWQISRTLGVDQAGARVVGWLVDSRRLRGWRNKLRRRVSAWWSIAAGAPIIGLSLFREGRMLFEVLTVVSFTTLMLTAFVVLRSDAAGGRCFAWTPTLVAGGVLLPLGVAFTPTPCTVGSGRSRLRQWTPAIILGAAAALLFAVAAAFPVPIIRWSAFAAITLVACTLVPVPPHDGAHLPRRWWVLLITVPLGAAAFALDLSWI